MTRERTRWPAVAGAAVATTALLVAAVVFGGWGTGRTTTPEPTAAAPPATTTPPASSGTPTSRPITQPTEGPTAGATAQSGQLVYYAGRRAHTGKWLLFAERAGSEAGDSLVGAVRAATAGTPADPDYTSLWGGNIVDSVRLHWDGDEGFYSVRLLDDSANTRLPGMSMWEAHIAIQQVVRTLHSVGEISAPVQFHVGDSNEPLTRLLGVPATGPYAAYVAAHYTGVLSSVNILTPENGAAVDELVEVSGLAESFEATVAVRVFDATGDIVHDNSTQATECCGNLFPFSYTLDTTGWPPGDYALMCLTDDPVGIEQGSNGPEIDTKTITVR